MKNLKFTLFILIGIFTELTTSVFAQTDTSKVKWLSFDDARQQFEKNQKPVLIFFHDTKNDSSNLMLNKTFGLQEVANYINILFYPVRMNIRSKETITFFDGKSYSNQEGLDDIHEMVTALLGKDAKMPAMILFTKNAVGTVYQGFKSRDQIFPLLIYYAESVYNSTTYDKFEKYYFKTYPPGQSQIMTRVLIKWKGIEEAFELNKTEPKKIIVNIYDNYSISSTMLNLKTFNNSIIAEYLNKNFYCVNLDARTKDTINILSQKYINEGATHGYHQLVIAMLNGKMVFPSFLILDEESKMIDRIQTYMIPEDFEVLAHFIGDNDYKTKKWDDYKPNFKSSFLTENEPFKNN